MIMVRVAAAPLESAVRPLRVGIVADLLDERWPSMDLVADMLMVHAGSGESAVSPVLMRPTFAPVLRQGGSQPPTSERIFHRFWSYPRWLRTQPPADVYHIVDHSYAHLAAALPPGRAVITCHDTDAFRALLATGERESNLPRFFVKRVLAGLRRAAVVACVSEHTRQELLAHDLVEPRRLVVVPNGVHPACTPDADAAADDDAMELTGPVGGADLLHVGSTIPRKRIDVLLEVLAAVARRRPSTRLWRVGGAFTEDQRARARELGVEHLVTVLPYVSRPVLAALYRRASLVVLTSEREGFGLPVVEAMACGAPVVCTDLPVLREVGGDAAEYCAIGDIEAWTGRILGLLAERDARGDAWTARRACALRHARRFTWAGNASAMQRIYARVATQAAVTA
jgi:glycosyltransferase involved in cell wall biosynthesis